MLSIIVAHDLNMAIGSNNSLPWHISQDLKRFKSITEGKTVIMGNKTYKSIGKPLPNRTNIVLSRSFNEHENITYITDYKQCLNIKDAFVIGGEQIYTLFMPYIVKLFITVIEHKFDNTDTYFNCNLDDFACISDIKFNDKYTYSFKEYIRK